jgi:hypothetical protein
MGYNDPTGLSKEHPIPYVDYDPYDTTPPPASTPEPTPGSRPQPTNPSTTPEPGIHNYNDFIDYVKNMVNKDWPTTKAKDNLTTTKVVSPSDFVKDIKDGVSVFSTSFAGGVHSGLLVVYTNEDGTRGFYAVEMHGNDPDIGGIVGGIYGKYEGYIMREYGGDFFPGGASTVVSHVDKAGNFHDGSFNDFFGRITKSEGVTFYKPIISGGDANNLKSVISSFQSSTAQWDKYHPPYGAVRGPNCNTFSHFAIINALGNSKWQQIDKEIFGSIGETVTR